MKSTRSQCSRILEWLKSGKGISNHTAIDEFKCYCLAARISDPKKRGYDIVTVKVGSGFGAYAEYHLVS